MEYRDYGKFTLLDHMGKGGVASVYRANDNENGIVLAIKVFEPSEKRTLNTVRRLRDREVRMLISVQHPNVVKFYDSGDRDDSFYYTMEFVENSLHHRMRSQEPLELADRVHILRQVCNALQAIHHQGIVHRDIKPANILLEQAPNGAFHVKVTDLGIAKSISEMKNGRKKGQSTRVPGTPKYLSPEQIRLQAVDGRADVYSLGIVAYELLSGQPPFNAKNTTEYLKCNLNEIPEPLNQVNKDIPSFVVPVVEKMMAKNREQRYDADTLARDMELIYQHLISNASLVEKRNTDSVFFDPGDESGDESLVAQGYASSNKQKTVAEPVTKWWAWPQKAAVIAISLLTLAYIFLRWPQMPEMPQKPNQIAVAPPQELSVSESLAKVKNLIDSEDYWLALVRLGKLENQELAAHQERMRNEMLIQTHNALAEPFLKDVNEKLKDENIADAETQLRTVQIRFPAASEIDRFADLVREHRQNIQSRKAWRAELQKLYDMIEDSNWSEAYKLTTETAKQQEGHSDRLSQLKDIKIQILNGWQKNLIESEATASQIAHCINVLEHYLGRDDFKEAINDRRPMLFVQTGNYFINNENYEDALEWFRKTYEHFPDSEAAQEAAEGINKLAEAGEFLPATVYELQDYIQEYHFTNYMWSAVIPEEADQQADENLLVMRLKRHSESQKNTRKFIRPIEPYSGFEISAEFRFKTEENGQSQVGIKIEDKIKNSVKLFFDGRNYQDRRDYMVSGRQMSGSSILRPGYQDEEDTWHELKISYRFDTSQLALYIDEQQVRQNRLELENFFISFYLKSAESEAHAAFRNFRIGVP